MARVAIFGIGNVLLGDDGVGPFAAHFLQRNYDFPDDVIVEDLGTPSLSLPGYLVDHDAVVFIDAIAVDAPPGTIRTFTREEIMAVQPGIRLSPHEPSINDALIMLDFLGQGPRDVTLVGIVPESLDGGVMLSDAVAAAVPEAAEIVRQKADGMRRAEGERQKSGDRRQAKGTRRTFALRLPSSAL